MKDFMKKNQFFTYSKMCTLAFAGAGALFLTSCAKDGFDDESFDSGVTNVQVESIPAENINVTPSADGKTQTFSWPVVMGAGGYRVKLIDVGNPDKPIINDSIVDGCLVTCKREEDVNYKLTILPLGNAKKNNTDAGTATEKIFSTFTPTFVTIPAGSNLNEWFAANPVPDDSIGVNLNYDLEGGAQYTVSGELDFDNHWVTLRSNSKSNPATIKYTDATSCINFAAPFNVKYLHFDCAAMSETNGVFGFSKNPTGEVKPETSFIVVEKPTTFISSTFDNVNGYFLWDSRKDAKVAFKTVLIDNCVVMLTPPKVVNQAVIWINKNGFINDFSVTNSTFYETESCTGDLKYFYQAGGYRAKDIGEATNSVSYANSTFYRIGWNEGEFGNYNAMKGKAESFWSMKDCIFMACSSKGGVPRRFLAGSAYSAGSSNVTFVHNTYMQADGSFDPVGNYDTSGTQIEEDPQFANTAAADFHISGPKQVSLKTGDPRWLP